MSRIFEFLGSIQFVFLINILVNIFKAGYFLIYPDHYLERYSVKRPVSTTAKDIVQQIGAFNICMSLLAIVGYFSDPRTKGLLLMVLGLFTLLDFLFSIRNLQSRRWKIMLIEIVFVNGLVSVINGVFFIKYFTN
jgi:hypothetical protein